MGIHLLLYSWGASVILQCMCYHKHDSKLYYMLYMSCACASDCSNKAVPRTYTSVCTVCVLPATTGSVLTLYVLVSTALCTSTVRVLL
jgi:hypothetical protein